jgi:hypothetical protein
MKILAAACCAALISGTAHAQLSDDSKRKLAAMINLSGQLCAKVNSVSSIAADIYTVHCTRYRDGTGSATYEVNLRTGVVK